LSTNEDAEVIEYMRTIKDEKHVLVKIDDCYGERQDMDCLFSGGEHVNGSVSIFNTSSTLTTIICVK
jgi:phosphopantetheine adenylyltransferase